MMATLCSTSLLTSMAESTLSVTAELAWLTQCASSMTKRSRTPRRYRLFNTDRSFSLALICDNKHTTHYRTALLLTTIITNLAHRHTLPLWHSVPHKTKYQHCTQTHLPLCSSTLITNLAHSCLNNYEFEVIHCLYDKMLYVIWKLYAINLYHIIDIHVLCTYLSIYLLWSDVKQPDLWLSIIQFHVDLVSRTRTYITRQMRRWNLQQQ